MTESPDGPVAAAARELYRLPPERFVEERDRRARHVRSEGDRDAAAAIGSLRKPTLPAWAVDQLVARDGDELRQLWAAGDAARGALEAQGDRSLREALADVRSLVGSLRARAAGYLEEIGATPDAHVDDIERTLNAAAVDPQARAEVVTGTLTRPLATSGFGALTGLQLAGPRPAQDPEDGDGQDAAGRRQREEERRRLEAEIERLDARIAEARDRAASLRERSEAARREADEREHERSALRDRLDELPDA